MDVFHYLLDLSHLRETKLEVVQRRAVMLFIFRRTAIVYDNDVEVPTESVPRRGLAAQVCQSARDDDSVDAMGAQRLFQRCLQEGVVRDFIGDARCLGRYGLFVKGGHELPVLCKA